MMRSMSLKQMQAGVVYLDLEGTIDNLALRRMADCIRDIRPRIEDAAERHGNGTTLVALIAVVANMAIARGDAALIAGAFRQNAEMLESEARVGACAGSARWPTLPGGHPGRVPATLLAHAG